MEARHALRGPLHTRRATLSAQVHVTRVRATQTAELNRDATLHPLNHPYPTLNSRWWIDFADTSASSRQDVKSREYVYSQFFMVGMNLVVPISCSV